MNYVPRGREQQQRANIQRQILWKRRKKFGRNKGTIGDGGNPTKTNPELAPNRSSWLHQLVGQWKNRVQEGLN